MIYNFSKGHASQKLAELFDCKIHVQSDFKFQKIVFNANQILNDGKHYFAINGSDQYVMFAYLKQFYTKKYASNKTDRALPKYHICICKTREKYSKFTFSNSMPVNIACRDTGVILKDIYLELCINCRREINGSLIGSFRRGVDWTEYILDLASKGELPNDRIGSNGYSVYWKQISYAKRSQDNFTCNDCGITLSDPSDCEYLEVHHQDHNKQNNHPSNLETLCTYCHSKKNDLHKRNYSYGLNKLKVDRFINLFH